MSRYAKIGSISEGTLRTDISQHAIDNAAAWWQNIKEMVAALDANEDIDGENAADRIQESVLSVEVRDGWHTPGVESVGNMAEEYMILLSTGGPALRIYGQLDRFGEPYNATLQWQDWGTPWTSWQPDPWDETYRDTLRTFASQFYFGD